METRLTFDILAQPDDSTCGPTCLQAVYRYFGDTLPLDQVIRDTRQLDDGGTLAVLLGCQALERGYDATIYTYNLRVFDPTWFAPGAPDLREKLRARMAAKVSDKSSKKTVEKMRLAASAYIDFLDGGGEIRFEDLTPTLIRRHLRREIPILTGLSATYLYRCAREVEEGGSSEYDDVRGDSMGHFVVLCGYDSDTRKVLVADPLWPNPMAKSHLYEVGIDTVLCAILLGILTYDANLIVIEPGERKKST
jgi:hypothetical protein